MSRPVTATVGETVRLIRSHAAHPTWSCLLRRQHVAAWLRAQGPGAPEPWPLETPAPVLRRLERAHFAGRGIRLNPAEIREVCGAGP